MKRTLFRITMLILLGLTFFAIFNFSSQDGQTSSGLSRKVARKIVDIFPYTKNLSEKTKNKIVEKSQPIIRKGAHFSIYMLEQKNKFEKKVTNNITKEELKIFFKVTEKIKNNIMNMK